MQINIKEIKWMDELLKKIGEMSVSKVLNKSIKKAIFLTERDWKKNTPVDTWLLRNSYETQFADLEGRLRNFREYWPIVEARQGFLSRTLTQVEPKVYRIFENDIQEFLQDLTE